MIAAKRHAEYAATARLTKLRALAERAGPPTRAAPYYVPRARTQLIERLNRTGIGTNRHTPDPHLARGDSSFGTNTTDPTCNRRTNCLGHQPRLHPYTQVMMSVVVLGDNEDVRQARLCGCLTT